MPTYQMSQGDLYLILPLVWTSYDAHQAVFGKYKKAKYTPALGTEALARLDEAMKLPSEQARGATPE